MAHSAPPKYTFEQLQAAKEADMLRKQFRAVPSAKFEPIDKDILEMLIHAAIFAQTRDSEGRPQVNFHTFALELGVKDKTVSRRIRKRIIYSNLITYAERDEKTDRWTIQVDRDAYRRAAKAYHAAMRTALESGQELVDPELIIFTQDVPKRGTPPRECDDCHVPMEERKRAIVYYRCPQCGKRHRDIVKDTGWIPPDTQAPAQESDESRTTCPPFKKAVTPPMSSLLDFFSDIAGQDASSYIKMVGTVEKKYNSHRGQLVRSHLEAHIKGDATYGTRLWRKDGRTRIFLVDADSSAAIERLEIGANKLASAGFKPIREYIPEHRPRDLDGYHNESRRYVLVMDSFVDAGSGWQHIYALAPEWVGLEAWPSVGDEPKGNRTRLPGGLYRMPEFSGWCELYSITDYESSSDGLEAVALLYSHQSSASLIPALDKLSAAIDEREREQAPAQPLDNLSITQERYSENSSLDNLSAAAGDNHFLIAFKPRDLAQRFLDEHQLADYIERGKNGKYFSPNGDERTPSAALYVKDGKELLTDFSTHGARADGTHDTIDVLELYHRQTGRAKREILRELGQLVHREAKAAIEAAAKDERIPLPAWIESRLTDYGRAAYGRLQADRGGVTALDTSPADEPSPQPGSGVVEIPAVAVPSVVPCAAWLVEQPCTSCSLPFQLVYRDINAPFCIRCSKGLPPKGGYPAELDALYPREPMKAPTPLIVLSEQPAHRSKKKKKGAAAMATTLIAAMMPL